MYRITCRLCREEFADYTVPAPNHACRRVMIDYETLVELMKRVAEYSGRYSRMSRALGRGAERQITNMQSMIELVRLMSVQWNILYFPIPMRGFIQLKHG
jgi:hypothetical protein